MKSYRLAVIAVAALLVAVPAAAELFHVKMINGNTIDTRYRPMVSTWDENTILMLTDVGNWIQLPRDLIADVISETEAKGFGKVIDTTTISLGQAPNDLPSEVLPEDPTTRLLNYFQSQGSNQPYSVNQFVEPSQAGGIPIGFGGGASSTSLAPIVPTVPQ